MVGDVGHDLAQRLDVGEVAGLGGQPAVPAGHPRTLDQEVARTAGRGERRDLLGEHGLVPRARPVDHDDVAGGLVESSSMARSGVMPMPGPMSSTLRRVRTPGCSRP